VSYRIQIYEGGEWIIRAEGPGAEPLINGLGVIPLLKLLEDGGRVYELDLRAVVGQDGEIVCLSPSERAAAEMVSGEEGRRVVPARIEPVPAAGRPAPRAAMKPG
jgi:hypothetical protein